jgi:hypothetical protein
MQGHTEETDAPVTDRLQSSGIPVPVREDEADEIDDLGIEDAVIRELARALQPRRGSGLHLPSLTAIGPPPPVPHHEAGAEMANPD